MQLQETIERAPVSLLLCFLWQYHLVKLQYRISWDVNRHTAKRQDIFMPTEAIM